MARALPARDDPGERAAPTAARRAARRRLGDFVHSYPGVPLRRAVARGQARWVRRLPGGLRRRLAVEGDLIEPLRIEIGGGPFPSPGYLHVDADRRSRHLEYVAPAWDLPFADGTVQEVLAIHVLEHVHPTAVGRTLREWRRVLRPAGYAQIHVPNAAAVFPAFLGSTVEKKWNVLIPIFGTSIDPALRRPGSLDLERHHAIYDFDLLRHVLLQAGFERVEDVTTGVDDRHNEGWREADLIPRLSLIVRAYAVPQ